MGQAKEGKKENKMVYPEQLVDLAINDNNAKQWLCDPKSVR